MRFPVSFCFFFCFVLFSAGMMAQDNYVPAADYTFGDNSTVDQVGNTELFLRNSAGLFDDPVQGKVLRFSSSEKGYAVFDKQLLDSDSSTIAFFFYWEDSGASSWHQLFEIYNHKSGSNLFFTPQNGWGANECTLISDSKEYNIYEALKVNQLPKNQWMHLAITFEGRTVSIYINGQLVTEQRLTVTPGAITGDSLFLGGNPYRSDNFYISARIDDLKIFDQTLTANQVDALARGNEIPDPVNSGTTWIPSGETINVTIDLDDKRQTIQNFGASDGWNTERIGKYWPLDKKEKIAELLFSTEKDATGSPKGIGLSAWRFNIGAGTAEQGESSRISHESRRTEGFLNSDGITYNWNKQSGQQWFLKKAAKDYSIHHLIGWQNSPPVEFTKNNLGFREYGASLNTILKQEHFNDYARFLGDVVEHFENEGVHFDYISPLNEPQYGWAATEMGGTVSQEGTPWTNQEIHDVVSAINSEFSERDINTKLFVSEAGSIKYHLENTGHAGNQLYNFWNPNSTLVLNEMASVANIVSYHSYWEDSGSSLIDYRKNFYEQVQLLDPVPQVWQTEYSLLGAGYRVGYPAGYKLTEMECALSLVKVILADLNVANVSGWQWWTTFEKGKHNGESRFSLIEAVTRTDNSDGIYHLNKLFYSFGNFSHFIRPGMKRLGIERSDNLTVAEGVSDVTFSAFNTSEEDKLVLLAANFSSQAREVSLTLSSETAKRMENASLFLTDQFTNLKKQNIDFSSGKFIVPANSVITYTADLNPGTSIVQQSKDADFQAYLNADKSAVIVSFEPEAAFQKVSLQSLSGNSIHVVNIRNRENQVRIPAENLATGLYIVVAKGQVNKSSQKIIIP